MEPFRDNAPRGTEIMIRQGRIQDFTIEGAQKLRSAHHEREARKLFNSAGLHRARLLEALRFKMLSRAIWDLF